jgi:hypothetical protein
MFGTSISDDDVKQGVGGRISNARMLSASMMALSSCRFRGSPYDLLIKTLSSARR